MAEHAHSFTEAHEIETDISKMETTSRNQNLFNYLSKEHGVTLLESEIDDIFNAIKQDGYFVFPKAEEGDFPDLSNWEGVEMEGKFGVNNTFVKSNILLKHGDYFLDCGFNITDFIRPIQPDLTPEEIVEKLGKDYLLNLIKEKENDKK
ncbi:hypothetical protein H0S70_07050 [Chryseobacterium manosquense]|uniref:Uncharacterized protein n=1 Tax=Chryseobacterium manosquense TaxID=2754694 RepID=A0A7H1DT55_9FLAO|nr:hypothetical protein [Chryseobacterium manosquense]QNS40163.1 hypothetical protein H0S70_07050 [Chryseobacterium manosquense]